MLHYVAVRANRDPLFWTPPADEHPRSRYTPVNPPRAESVEAEERYGQGRRRECEGRGDERRGGDSKSERVYHFHIISGKAKIWGNQQMGLRPTWAAQRENLAHFRGFEAIF